MGIDDWERHVQTGADIRAETPHIIPFAMVGMMDQRESRARAEKQHQLYYALILINRSREAVAFSG